MESEVETCSNYECKYSNKAVSLTILNEEYNKDVKCELESLYNFHLNKNKNGVESSSIYIDCTCVITLYFNKTIGCTRKMVHDVGKRGV